MNISYLSLSRHFDKVKNLDVKQVGKLIGGKVEYNTGNGIFRNACALRMSYALKHSGVSISGGDGAVSSGADGNWYLYRVEDIIKLIQKTIVIPSINSDSKSYKSDFKDKRGIIVFSSCGWTDSTGHVDLFDGKNVEGKSYESGCNNIKLFITD